MCAATPLVILFFPLRAHVCVSSFSSSDPLHSAARKGTQQEEPRRAPAPRSFTPAHTHTHTHTHTLYGLATLAASIQAAGGLPPWAL